jgi:hypothetical protein
MSSDLRPFSEFEAHRTQARGVDPPLFRFGLRKLLAFVAILSILMAAMATLQGVPSLVLLLTSLVVAGHLFSTALGTQLRSHANRATGRYSPGIDLSDPRETSINCPTGHIETLQPTPRSPWQVRHSTPLPWLARLIAAAFVIGAASGAMLLWLTVGHETSQAGIVVGAFSLAVVASWFAFLGYSFYGVFRHGLHDAMLDDRVR